MSSFRLTKAIIAFVGIALLLLSGCVDQPSQRTLILPENGGGIDTNRLWVTPPIGATSCDTTCDFFDNQPSGANYACIYATDISGASDACNDTLSNVSCMCNSDT